MGVIIQSQEGDYMKKSVYVILVVLVFLITAAIVAGTSTGPPDGRTGAPNESDCTVGCHNTYSLNSGDGSFSINDVPVQYNPGETYSLSVSIQDSGQQKWGFELTVLDNSSSAGTLIVTDSTNTQLSTATGRHYIKHTNTGTFDGTADGPVSWSFDWTAPSAGTGTVTFYAAGNAANSGSGNKFDYIYTTTETSDEAGGGGTTNQPPTCTISSPSSGAKLSGTATIFRNFCRFRWICGACGSQGGQRKLEPGNWNLTVELQPGYNRPFQRRA
jgi:hypothetical protein